MPASDSSSALRVSLWEWAQAALLVSNLAWTILCRGGVRAETMVVTLVLTAALLGVHFLARALERGDTQPRAHPAGWWLVPFLVYAAANVAWVTPVPWLGWLDWLGWAQMIAVFWVVLNGMRSHGPRRILFLALIALAIAGVLLACYQRFIQPDWLVFGRIRPAMLDGRVTGSFGISNSFAGFLLLLLPAVGALAFRRAATATERVWWGWVGVVLLLGLVFTISRGAWLALAAAMTVWPLIAARGTWVRRLGFALLMLVLIGVVGTAVYWKSPEVRARFTALMLQRGEITRPFMWRGAWQLFRDEPVFGTGGGSYNVLFERHRVEGFRDEPLWAHNEYLNTLSDYGAAGFILFFGVSFAIAIRCVKSRRDEKRRRSDWLDSSTVISGLGIGGLAFAFQMALDFHLKIPGLALAFATLAGLAVARAWPIEAGATRRQFVPPIIASIGAGMVVCGLLVLFVPMLRAEAFRQQGREIIDRLAMVPSKPSTYAKQLPAARSALARATDLNPANAQAWADRAYATAAWALADAEPTDALGREAEIFADRALGITGRAADFWIRRGVARDMQGRWSEAGKDFAQAVAIAPADAHAWYYYAEHFSRVKAAREAAEAALAFCLRLDPGNPGGLALRQRLAIKPTGH